MTRKETESSNNVSKVPKITKKTIAERDERQDGIMIHY